MTSRPLDMSVVICAYTEERWTQLLEAIESVKSQSLPPRETIICIDHNLRLLERLRESVHGATIVESVGQKGKSGALNTAIELAAGSIVVLLDDDAAAEPGWLEALHRHYQDPQVLGVGGHLEPVWAHARPRWFPEEFLWVVGCSFRGMPRRATKVRAVIGANMSFRREVFLDAGGSRPGLGPNGTQLAGAARAEDTEFCLRASLMRPEMYWIYEPAARVSHHVPASRATWSFFRSRCAAEGRSKAVLAKLVGRQRGLAMERSYSLRTLPSGLLIELAAPILKRDIWGIGRAIAIVAGFSFTLAGYVWQTFAFRRAAPAVPTRRRRA